MTTTLSIVARIVPTGHKLARLPAGNPVKDKGDLPRNVVLGKHLLDGTTRKLLGPEAAKIDNAFPLIAREFCAHPGKGSFADGKDIVDEKTGLRLSWTDAVKHIEDREITREKTALLVDPEIIVVDGKTQILVPLGIKATHPIAGPCKWGKADPVTDFPIEIAEGELAALPESERRKFPLIEVPTLSAIIRFAGLRGGIYPDYSHESAIGSAAYVVYDAFDETGRRIIESLDFGEIVSLKDNLLPPRLRDQYENIALELKSAVRELGL